MSRVVAPDAMPRSRARSPAFSATPSNKSFSADKAVQAEALGADIVIDRSKNEDWSKALFIATEKRGVDMVVDNVGTTFPLSLRALRKGGRLLTVGNSGSPRFEIDNRFIFAKHLSILGSTMSTLADFREVMDLVITGKLKPIIDRTYPLKDAASAQERLWLGENFGKTSQSRIRICLYFKR